MSSVDVIVPCYQYGHFLEECVASVLSQTGPTVRVLIIDDASRDHTREIGEKLAASDPRVTYVRHVWNRGHINTFNEGLAWAASKYTLLLSADDRLLPGALSRATALMEEYPEIGFTFGSVLYMYPDGSTKAVVPAQMKTSRQGTMVLSGRQFIEMSGAVNMVATPTVVVRTELQKRLGGYRPELTHAGDMEMWLRFASRAPVGFVRAPQGVYRRHERNMSSGYAAFGMLPDVQQRRAALDLFFENAGAMLDGASLLRTKFERQLAEDAVALASSALNCGERGASAQIATLALEICPEVKRSWGWAKLALKRRLDGGMKQVMETVESCRRRKVCLSPRPRPVPRVCRGEALDG